MSDSKETLTDLPDDWDVSEEQTEEAKPAVKLNSRYLWALFITAFAVGLAYVLLTHQPSPSGNGMVVYVNDVPITSDSDPIVAIRSLPSRRDLVGTFINADRTPAEENGLLELGEVLKDRTILYSGGSGYNINLGLTERTGIFVHDNYLTIEGEDENSLWKAIWAFSSLISDSEISSSVDLTSVPRLLYGKKNVSVVIDDDNGCSNWGLISSALGNVQGALGFQRASSGFTLNQYLKTGGSCELQFSIPDGNMTASGCPDPSKDFIVTLKQGDNNRIEIRAGGIELIYRDCSSLIRQSLILRDILAPMFLTGMQRVSIPMLPA
ncbi:MAG: hypothetical protein JXB14_00170 [Candidatus Altiarchaeota archaeon]|nr:hypothetical protein [Candidatus Altiarchaeota archaeon]